MKRAAMRALLSHWRRQPVQLATLLVGLALATALWSAVQAINQQARESYDTAAAMLGGTSSERLVPRTGDTIPVQTYTALRRAGWQVSPVIEGSLRVNGRAVTVIGLDPLTAPPGTLPPEMARALQAAPGSMLSTDAPGFAAPELIAENLGNPLPTLIPARGLAPRVVVMDIAQASALLGPDPARLILHPDQPLRRPPLTQIAPDLRVDSAGGTGDLARLTDSFHLNLTAFGLLSFAVGLFIVHSGIGLAFEQRRPLIRTLRALGLPLRTLLALLLAELLTLALVAGAIGLVLGYVIAGALLPDVSATLRGLYGAPVGQELGFSPAWALSGMAIAVLGALAAAGAGLLGVARMPLLASAGRRAWAMGSGRAMRRQAIVGAGLLGAGVLASLLFDGVLAGFALLGGLLMAAALMLPLALSGLLALGARLTRRPLGHWFWADTRQQLPGLSLALMALLLALSTNIGVGTMVSSFRSTFIGWLDQRLASEIYVAANSNAQGDALRAWLTPRVEAVLPIWSVTAPLAGRPGAIYGVIDHATYRDNWPLLNATADVWDSLQSSNGVLVNEHLARRANLRLGDRLTLGPGWDAPVTGVFSDYGNPLGQAIVGLAPLTSHHPDLPRLRYGLRVTADQVPALRAALIAEFGLTETQITDQAAIKAASLAVFEQTFAVTGALNVLTLTVAGFAMLTSLLTLAALRLPQLAPVWALGLPRARLARLELIRALVLATATWLAALPTGLALAWVLLSVVNVEAFGWRLPLYLFPGQWITLLVLALLAAALASLYPARQLSRTAPSHFLKVFAHER